MEISHQGIAVYTELNNIHISLKFIIKLLLDYYHYEFIDLCIFLLDLYIIGKIML